MKKYILFDNDGVLVETEKWYFNANVEILKTMGIDLDETRYLDIMVNGQSAFLLAEEQGFDSVTVENARDRRNELYQHYLHTEDIEIPGVKEVLDALAKKYRICGLFSFSLDPLSAHSRLSWSSAPSGACFLSTPHRSCPSRWKL